MGRVLRFCSKRAVFVYICSFFVCGELKFGCVNCICLFCAFFCLHFPFLLAVFLVLFCASYFVYSVLYCSKILFVPVVFWATVVSNVKILNAR